jgi:hypothetical protein
MRNEGSRLIEEQLTGLAVGAQPDLGAIGPNVAERGAGLVN